MPTRLARAAASDGSRDRPAHPSTAATTTPNRKGLNADRASTVRPPSFIEGPSLSMKPAETRVGSPIGRASGKTRRLRLEFELACVVSNDAYIRFIEPLRRFCLDLQR